MKKTIKIISAKNISLHELTPYENNSKIHTVKQLEGIAQSISRFGFLQPLVVDKQKVIVAGHGRYEAAAALGMEKIPCVVVDDLTEDEIKAFRILDNKLAEGETDQRKLDLELAGMSFDFTPFKFEFKPAKLNLATQEEKPIHDQTEFTVLVNCTSEYEQQQVYNEMQDRGYQCKLIM